MIGVDPCREHAEVNLSKECKFELHDLAAALVPQLSADSRFDVLLVADAPVDVLDPGYRGDLLFCLVPGG